MKGNGNETSVENNGLNIMSWHKKGGDIQKEEKSS